MKNKTGNASALDKSAEKRAIVLGVERPKVPLARTIAVAVVLLAGGSYFLLGNRSVVDAAEASSQAPAYSSKSAVLTLSDFDDGKARFYTLDDGGGAAVRYYAVKGTDGKVHTAYDACDACWVEGKGYKQSGDSMICNNCGRSFSINKIGEVHGGCNPSPLAGRVENGKLVIDLADIVAGRHYFELPQK